jgi:hypothetical protein
MIEFPSEEFRSDSDDLAARQMQHHLVGMKGAQDVLDLLLTGASPDFRPFVEGLLLNDAFGFSSPPPFKSFIIELTCRTPLIKKFWDERKTRLTQEFTTGLGCPITLMLTESRTCLSCAKRFYEAQSQGEEGPCQTS